MKRLQMFKKERTEVLAGGAATFAVWFLTGLSVLCRGNISRYSYALVWAMLLTFIYLYYKRVWISWKVLEDEIENKQKIINALEVMQGKLELIRQAREQEEKEAGQDNA